MKRTIKSALAAIALVTGASATPAAAQSVDQVLYQLSYACMQGNMFACNRYDMIMMAQQRAYMQQMMAQQPVQTPEYDPNNVMGPTHQQRMNNIKAFGAQNTANFNARGAANDARNKAFLESLSQ